MKSTIICLKSFTTRDPNSGRSYAYAAGEVVKGRKLDYVKDAHFARGIFAIAGTDKDCSIKRRLEGRIVWHRENGTEENSDLEYQVHRCMIDFFGNDLLREKGSGQTAMFESLIQTVRAEFAGRYTVEHATGNDDIRTGRDGTGGRDILWAADNRAVIDCIAFCCQYLTKYEI